MLQKTSQPFFEMVKSWISYGLIEDRFSEFFIGQNDVNESHKVWTEKYFFREAMRPKFLPEEICKKVRKKKTFL
jgi:hypothetical protein